MKKIVVDNDTLAKLQADQSGVEISDSSGNIVGYFVCPEIYWGHAAAWQQIEEADIALLEQIAQEKDTCTLEEILNELGAK